jgi:hypothetical protein
VRFFGTPTIWITNPDPPLKIRRKLRKPTHHPRKPYPKKEFREILEGEGYAVKNCTRHANQVRVFGVKNAEVAVV